MLLFYKIPFINPITYILKTFFELFTFLSSWQNNSDFFLAFLIEITAAYFYKKL